VDGQAMAYQVEFLGVAPVMTWAVYPMGAQPELTKAGDEPLSHLPVLLPVSAWQTVTDTADLAWEYPHGASCLQGLVRLEW
jgi:hypothetical protein